MEADRRMVYGIVVVERRRPGEGKMESVGRG
jgi:hypothetical protein